MSNRGLLQHIKSSVNITPVAAPAVDLAVNVSPSSDMLNPAGNAFFQPGENVTIQYIMVKFPYLFGLSSGNISLTFARKNAAGVSVGALPIGAVGVCTIPQPNIYVPYMTFTVRPLGATTEKYKITLENITCNVSMINGPASLVGVAMPIDVIMLVQCTRDIVP